MSGKMSGKLTSLFWQLYACVNEQELADQNSPYFCFSGSRTSPDMQIPHT
jgi:hypothetical protein